MQRTLFALSLGLAVLMIIPGILHAEPQCAAHQLVADQLAQKYGEARRSIGLASDNTVMELYASALTGTWTMTVTLPRGLTCLVASGDSFDTTKDTLPAKGNPA